MADFPELTRFTLDNSSIKDANGKFLQSSLKDLDKQINEVTKALESATNSIVYVSKTVTDAGRAVVTFDVPKHTAGNAQASFDSTIAKINQQYGYDTANGGTGFDVGTPTQQMRSLVFNRSFYGTKSKQELKRIIGELGGEVTSNPVKGKKDQMRIRVPISEQDYQDAMAQANNDVFKATGILGVSFTEKNLKSAVKYSDNVKNENDEKKKEQEKKTGRLKTLMALGAIIKGLQVVADITRRILTAALTKATEVKRDSVDAKSLGVSYTNLREYKSQARAMGMDENVFNNALSQIQSAFGDISNLDSKALGELAKVMSGDVLVAIQNGLGKSDPERVMKEILNAYYERGQNGVNSLGMNVGKYQAERELATALEKAGLKDTADILRNMFYTNDTGIHRGQISNGDSFADFMALFTAYTLGLTPNDQKAVSELGQVIDQLKEKFNLLKENLEKGLLLALDGLINKINNFDFFKSPNEKANDTKKNINNNNLAIERFSQKANVAKSLFLSSFEDSSVDISKMTGGRFTDIESYLNFTKTKEGRYWRPKTEEGKAEEEKLIAYLRTDEGMQAIKQWQAYEVAQEKVNEARENIKKGLKEGKVVFNPTDFTEASYQRAVRDGITGTWFSDKYSAVNLLYKVKGNNAHEAFINDNNLYEAVKDTYFGGKDITYADALASGESKELTNDLYEQAMGLYKRNAPKKYKQVKKQVGFSVSQEEKQNVVAEAMRQKTLSPFDVRDAVKKHIKNLGWGISLEQWDLISSLSKEKGLAGFEDYAGAINALAQGLGLKEAQEFLKVNSASGYTANVGSIDPKTQNVTITLIAKDSDSSIPKATLTFMTDSVSNNSYVLDMNTGKASAQ